MPCKPLHCCYTTIIMESTLCSWSADFGIDSTRSLIPCMTDPAAQCCLLVQLWLLYWDLVVIDHSVVLTQDETSLAFRDLQGSVTTRNKCGFNRQKKWLRSRKGLILGTGQPVCV